MLQRLFQNYNALHALCSHISAYIVLHVYNYNVRIAGARKHNVVMGFVCPPFLPDLVRCAVHERVVQF